MRDELLDTADEIVGLCKEIHPMSLHVLCNAITKTDMSFVMVGGSGDNRARMKKIAELLELSNFTLHGHD